MAGHRRAVLQRPVRRSGRLGIRSFRLTRSARPCATAPTPGARCVMVLLALLALMPRAHADESEGRRILIADPFIELHTGPGRGYPVFHVVERGREVTVIKRRTDWFQIRTDRGVEGWAPREQLIATLEPTGEPLDLEEPTRENYMRR